MQSIQTSSEPFHRSRLHPLSGIVPREVLHFTSRRTGLPPEIILWHTLLGLRTGKTWASLVFTRVSYDRVVGGPSWIYPGELYITKDITLRRRWDDSVAEKFGKDCGTAFFRASCGYREQILLMFQSLLADRFKLKVRRETRQVPVYALVVAKDGPKFAASARPDSVATAQNSTLPPPKRTPCPAGMLCVHSYDSMGFLADIVSRSLPKQTARSSIRPA